MVAREEHLLLNSASFENVFQICVQYYVTLPPLLSFFINTTPFPPDPSEFWECFPNLHTCGVGHYVNFTTLLLYILFAQNTSWGIASELNHKLLHYTFSFITASIIFTTWRQMYPIFWLSFRWMKYSLERWYSPFPRVLKRFSEIPVT